MQRAVLLGRQDFALSCAFRPRSTRQHPNTVSQSWGRERNVTAGGVRTSPLPPLRSVPVVEKGGRYPIQGLNPSRLCPRGVWRRDVQA